MSLKLSHEASRTSQDSLCAVANSTVASEAGAGHRFPPDWPVPIEATADLASLSAEANAGLRLAASNLMSQLRACMA